MKKLIKLIRNFGFLFTFKYCFYKFTKQNDKYIKLIYDYLSKFLQPIIKKYNEDEDSFLEKQKSNYIWTCWWQGYQMMPDLCKKCYDNLKSILDKNFELILITKDNYSKYVDIPNIIIEKLNLGLITITQFSDVLREALIVQNGGTWIDVSVWCTPNINNYLHLDLEFWSVKLFEVYDNSNIGQLISNCMWSGFILSGVKNSLVLRFALDSMIYYYSNYSMMIDYFMQNLIIRIAYENISKIRSIIDDVSFSNPNLYVLYPYMNCPYDEHIWLYLTSSTCFFKLTQKCSYLEQNGTSFTFYHRLFNDVVKDVN